MRNIVIALLLLGVADCGLGQENAAAPPASASSQTEHLLKAAEHLEAAGLTEDAQKIRQRIDQEKLPSAASDTAAPAGDHQPQVVLHLRVMEISRTKLRQLGFSFSRVCSDQGKSDSGSITDFLNPPGFRVLASNDNLFPLLDALHKDRLARVLAEPTIVSISNRATSFRCGGQARVAVPQGKGQVTVEEKFYGTSVDFVPVVLADRTIHLTCRIEVSHLETVNSVTIAGETVPVLAALNVETTSDCKSGQTVALGGLRQLRGEAAEEIETLVLLTPEIDETKLSENAARAETRR